MSLAAVEVSSPPDATRIQITRPCCRPTWAGPNTDTSGVCSSTMRAKTPTGTSGPGLTRNGVQGGRTIKNRGITPNNSVACV